ncbi:zinc finger protein 660-like isoform X15 [Athalia rosae]|uniref:zinc finger protein 660-like isoform X15 n=1 Tax=Athalia rosae TaxID=37344 RepID=UPI0020333A2D|nr:zinc finger protein 660-like isoform X15 [Athalia rosae]
MSSLDYLDLCRLCLVKDGVSVPIFEGEGDVRQIFLKIAACLPVKVAREDKLPKKICDNCVYKVELLYQFWNTTANAEKQLLQWLGEVGLEDKQGYVTGVLNTSTMKEEDDASSVIQSSIATTTPQSGIGIGVIDNIGLGMPFSGTTHQQQLPPTIPINQPIHQALPGPSNQPAPDQLSQTQGNATTRPQDEEEESSEEEDNSDDDCDADDGLPVKEESEEDLGNSRNIEPTTFVNVSLACDEAGPSGLQQQKNTTEIPELSMPQTLNESDAKSGKRKLEERKKAEPVANTTLFTPCSTKNKSLSPVAVDPNREKITSNKKIESEWKCRECDRICVNRELFRKHQVVHSTEFKFSCNVCEKKFKRSFELKVHSKSHSNTKDFDCDICSSSFKLKSQLTIHKKRHTLDYKILCEFCQKGFHTNADYKSHKFAKHTANEHICDICGKAYNSKNALDKHSKIHEPDYMPEKRNQCEVCGKLFATKKSLKLHVRTHTGEKNYTCDTCGKKLCTRASLKEHTRLHTGQRPVVCHFCTKTFTKRSTMTVHMRTHTGERPYTCDICQKTFTQRTSLVIHRRYHSGERPYVCNICPKGFVSGAQLKVHQNYCC